MSRYQPTQGWSVATRVAESCNGELLVAANAKGDFVLAYRDYDSSAQKLVLVPYFDGVLGAAHTLTTASKPMLDYSWLEVDLRDDRTITAAYVNGTGIFVTEATSGTQWAPATHIADIEPCVVDTACEMRATFGRDGDGLVVWGHTLDDVNHQQQLWYAVRSAGQWSTPVKFSEELNSGTFGLARNEEGEVVVAYAGIVAADLPTELRIYRYTKGNGWARQKLPDEGIAAIQPDVSISPDGHAVIAWKIFAGNAFELWSTQGAGGQWARAERVATRADILSLAVSTETSVLAWVRWDTHEVSVAQLE